MKRIVWLILCTAVILTGCQGAAASQQADALAERDAALAQNKELVHQFSEAENSRAYDQLDAIVADDFQRHSAATPEVQVGSRDELKSFFQENAAVFSDYKTTIETMVAEDDLVAVYATFSGTMDGPMGEDIPATNQAIEMPFVGIFRIENGRVAELWVEWDNINFLSQAGLME